MSNSWVDQRVADPDARRMFEQERLILSATSRIYESMEAAEVSKADLARHLATSRANVTALLSGNRNMTLRTLADLASVLGQRVEISLEPLLVQRVTLNGGTAAIVSPAFRPPVREMEEVSEQSSPPKSKRKTGARRPPKGEAK